MDYQNQPNGPARELMLAGGLMLSALEFDGRRARIRFERTNPDVTGPPHLRPVCETELS